MGEAQMSINEGILLKRYGIVKYLLFRTADEISYT